ncbi:adenosylcobinamide-GDP ribazoletransferase [Porphyromonas gulae]|uniref:adenosylcobinamide-GDP ribazoletransferase n=1 Tax=Porphyromonas gulae TaxID=111105 RepID=UPI00051D2FEC|nr:adenosylcobinamide-GDP ribazoletransferase [Porphyromonas gulae]KGL47982.1 cobalamin 5'-phosphate synthase [Porphyromonas gulae]
MGKEQTKAYQRVLAAFMLLTRLPLWRVVCVPNMAFKRATDYWSLVGWITAGLMALIYWLCLLIDLPAVIAVSFALLSRILLTGAFHEDGLGDFIDGFGAGRTKERILAIMKDSHVGTYGILSFIFYFMIGIYSLSSLPPSLTLLALAVGDPLCKMVASQLINTLPYARSEGDSKVQAIYSPMGALTFMISLAAGALPLVLFLPLSYWPAVSLPILAFLLLHSLMKWKIGGYTGDCCGATFLLCELSFWVGILIVDRIIGS